MTKKRNKTDPRLYEEIIDELRKLKELSEETPIIVEGRNDEKALKSLGINAKFFLASNGTPLCDFCDEIANNHSEVILLTDIDREGGKIAKRLRDYLSHRGVKVNEKFRLNLLSKLDTHQVENLHTRFKRVEEALFSKF